MKRAIIICIFTIICSLAFASGAYAQNTTAETLTITTSDATSSSTPRNEIKLKVESNSGIDLSNNLITWTINRNKRIEQGVGLTEITIPTEYDTVYINVRMDIKESDGSITSHIGELELTQSLQNEVISKSNVLVGIDSEGIGCDDYKIISNPARPMMYQRVAYTVVKNDNSKISNVEIAWFLNDKEKSREIGQTTFIIRSVSSSKKMKIRAEVGGSCAERTYVPRDDPSLRLHDTKATRIANCAAQSLRLLQRDYNIINRRADLFNEKYENTKENFEKDIAFLKSLVTDLPAEITETTEELTKRVLAIGTARPGETLFSSIIKQLTEFGKYLLNNDISKRIAYIQKQIKYYERLIDWLNASQYNVQAETDSMIKRIDRQKARCIEVADKQSDDLIEIGSVREFKKYEW